MRLVGCHTIEVIQAEIGRRKHAALIADGGFQAERDGCDRAQRAEVKPFPSIDYIVIVGIGETIVGQIEMQCIYHTAIQIFTNSMKHKKIRCGSIGATKRRVTITSITHILICPNIVRHITPCYRMRLTING